VLVTHGAIKPPLRNVIARRLKVDGTQALVSFVLTKGRLRECKAGCNRGRDYGEC
jgi:hypothetical protein